MAKLPVKTLLKRVADTAVQQALDSIVTPVDALLGFVNGSFTLANNVLTVAQKFVIPGLTVNGSAQITGSQAVGGNQTVGGTLGVTGATTLSGGLNTPNGIRMAIGPGNYNSSANAGGTLQQVFWNQATSAFAPASWIWTAPFAGSVVAISGYYFAAIPAGGAARVELFKNGTLYIQPSNVGPGTNGFYHTFARGTYRFNPGETFTGQTVLHASYNQACEVYMIVELDT